MMVPTFIILGLLWYLPMIRGLIMAFQHYSMLNLSNKSFTGLANFAKIVFDPNVSFIGVLFNTFIWVAVSLILQFGLGFALALLMRKPFPGRGIYSGFVFYTWALSGFAIGLVWAWMFNGEFGVVNDLLTRMGLIHKHIPFLSSPKFAMISVIVANVWYGIPFFAIMLLSALQSVPKELYESADIDGAGKARQLFSITVPYVMPVIVSTTLLRTIWIMNFPDVIYGMTDGGPVNSTTTLSIQMINKVFKDYNYGQGSAVGVIIMLILFIYAFFYLRVMSGREAQL